MRHQSIDHWHNCVHRSSKAHLVREMPVSNKIPSRTVFSPRWLVGSLPMWSKTSWCLTGSGVCQVAVPLLNKPRDLQWWVMVASLVIGIVQHHMVEAAQKHTSSWFPPFAASFLFVCGKWCSYAGIHARVHLLAHCQEGLMVALGKQKMLQTYHSQQSWCWFLPLGFLLDDIRGLWVRNSVGNVVFTELYHMCKLWNTL
jgi:hypothetical protein